MAKPKVNQKICIGCGTCEALCPDVFKLKNNKSQVISEDCKNCDCQEAINNCPVSAISME